jgi:LacI family transcriptional regulator
MVPGEYVRELDPETADGREVLEGLLGLDEPPTAIFSSNTRSSLRLLPALHRLGRTDVAFVSFGDFPTAEVLAPPVTVVNHSPELIGRLAAQRLFRRMSGDELSPETIVAPVELIPRGSGEVTP